MARMKPGDLLPTVTRLVSQELMGRYTHSLGAGNPIHFDAAFAAATRFGGPIASGPIALALLDDVMAGSFPIQWLSGGHLSVAFVKPVRPGDTVQTRVRLRGSLEVTDGERLEFDVACVNQDGAEVLAGTASVEIHKEASDG